MTTKTGTLIHHTLPDGDIIEVERTGYAEVPGVAEWQIRYPTGEQTFYGSRAEVEARVKKIARALAKEEA